MTLRWGGGGKESGTKENVEPESKDPGEEVIKVTLDPLGVSSRVNTEREKVGSFFMLFYPIN